MTTTIKTDNTNKYAPLRPPLNWVAQDCVPQEPADSAGLPPPFPLFPAASTPLPTAPSSPSCMASPLPSPLPLFSSHIVKPPPNLPSPFPLPASCFGSPSSSSRSSRSSFIVDLHQVRGVVALSPPAYYYVLMKKVDELEEMFTSAKTPVRGRFSSHQYDTSAVCCRHTCLEGSFFQRISPFHTVSLARPCVLHFCCLRRSR